MTQGIKENLSIIHRGKKTFEKTNQQHEPPIQVRKEKDYKWEANSTTKLREKKIQNMATQKHLTNIKLELPKQESSLKKTPISNRLTRTHQR